MDEYYDSADTAKKREGGKQKNEGSVIAFLN